MTIVACDQTRCMYNREAQGNEEKQIAKTVCKKDYIVMKTPYKCVPPRPLCDDFEVEESEDGEPP